MNDFPTTPIRVIEGELDVTREIPLLQLQPPVPAPQRQARARSARRRRAGSAFVADGRRYVWLIGLIVAGLIFYAPILARGLGETAPWVVLLAVAWTVLGAPIALLIGYSIRLAEGRVS